MSRIPDHFEKISITREMLDEALELVPATRVRRTRASSVDTLTGHLGEMVFAEYFLGNWRNHRIGKNQGKEDFDGIEVKASATPFSTKRHLLVRCDYASKRKPKFYVQVILDVDMRRGEEIGPGAEVALCGFATAEEVDAAPLKDWGAKEGWESGYECHSIPISNLRPIDQLKDMMRDESRLSNVPQTERSQAILEALAEGVDPFTGEVLPAEHLCRDVDVCRAFADGLKTLKQWRKKQERPLPANAGKPWSDKEDAELIARFDEGKKIKDLAEEHARTTGAIKARLEKWGKIVA